MITRTYNFGRGPAEGKLDNTLYHNVTMTIEDLTVTWPNYVIGVAGSAGWQGVVGTGGDSDDPQVMLFNRPIKSASILFNEVNYYGTIMVAYDEDDVEIGRCTLDLTWFNDHGEMRAFISFPTNRIAKILVSGEPAGDWITWSQMVFVRDVPAELPEFNLDAPKFEFGVDQETVMALRLPATTYLRYLPPAIGGDIEADSGRRAAYRIRQDEFVAFVLRFFEQEWPLVSAWLDEVMNGQQFLFFPINTEDDAFFVTLESPAPGSSYSTQPDGEFPKVLTLAIVLKAVSSFDGLNPVPISDAGPDEGPPDDSEPPPDEIIPVEATGGEVIIDGGYTVHIFEASDTFHVIVGGEVEFLMVGGGGGGGGGHRGNGAGAGGIIEDTTTLAAGDYPIVIGEGGACGPWTTVTAESKGTVGEDTTFADLTAAGGGYGSAGNYTVGGHGGSGGAGGFAGVPGTGTPGQGRDAGTSFNGGPLYGAGGGGGANSAGGNATGSQGGNGGAGVNSDIRSTGVDVGGGGSGDVYGGYGHAPGTASHGGGVGDNVDATQDGRANATDGTGGGGGGNGRGGKGIVIIRYCTLGEMSSSRVMPSVSGTRLLDWAADLLAENDGDPLSIPSPSERGSSLTVSNSGAGMPVISRLGSNNIKTIHQWRTDTSIDFLSGSPHTDFVDDFTYYLVCKVDSIPGGIPSSGQFFNGASIIQGEASGTTSDYGLALFSTGAIAVGSGGSGDATSTPGGNLLDGDAHVVVLRRRKSDGLMEGIIDGSIVTAINTAVGVSLAGTNPGSPYFYQVIGDYARILGYNARHSDAEVVLIVNALRSYYGF